LVLLLPVELDLTVRIDSWQARKAHRHHLAAARGSTPGTAPGPGCARPPVPPPA